MWWQIWSLWQNSLKTHLRSIFTWLHFSATIFQTWWRIMNLWGHLSPLFQLISSRVVVVMYLLVVPPGTARVRETSLSSWRLLTQNGSCSRKNWRSSSSGKHATWPTTRSSKRRTSGCRKPFYISSRIRWWHRKQFFLNILYCQFCGRFLIPHTHYGRRSGVNGIQTQELWSRVDCSTSGVMTTLTIFLHVMDYRIFRCFLRVDKWGSC